MRERKLTRRRFLATTAASTAIIAMPYVRGAYAAGKLSIGFWDHWVPGANKASTGAVRGMGRQGEGRGLDRLHHLAGQQEPADHRRRGAGAVRPRHLRLPDLAAGRPRQSAGAGRRHHGGADQAQRHGQPDRRVSGQAGRPLGRGAGRRRQPDQGPVLAHRSHEEASPASTCRRCIRRARRRRPTPGRSTPCSRPPRPATRPASRSASGSARPRTTSTPPARSSSRSAPTWSTPRATSRSRPTPCARRSNTTRSWRSGCRRTRRPGTTPPTTST